MTTESPRRTLATASRTATATDNAGDHVKIGFNVGTAARVRITKTLVRKIPVGTQTLVDFIASSASCLVGADFMINCRVPLVVAKDMARETRVMQERVDSKKTANKVASGTRNTNRQQRTVK
jgi:hypothetical protein